MKIIDITRKLDDKIAVYEGDPRFSLETWRSIDKDGFIRNCPSMPQHFGNIKDTSLENALNHPDFRKYWNVNKDIIEVCKDCEFRHICTDCRAYTERTHFEEDIDLSKPLKCGYNPYTNEWAEWSTNPLKQIDSCEFEFLPKQSFVFDHLINYHYPNRLQCPNHQRI